MKAAATYDGYIARRYRNARIGQDLRTIVELLATFAV